MSEPEGEWAEAPRKGGLVTALGIMNLILGFSCGCLGLAYGVLGMFLPQFVDAALQTAQAQMSRQRAALVERVASAEAELAAVPADSEEAAEIQTRVDSFEAQLTRLDQQDPGKALQAVRDFIHGPAIAGMFFGYASIAFLWNVGLIVTAFGLFGRRPWARSVLFGLAATKMLLELGFGLWVASTFPGAMNDVLGAIPTNAAGGPTPAELAQIRASMQMQGVLNGLIGSVFGSVYPAAVLIVLMLRSVRQEFSDWAHYRLGSWRG